MADQCAVDGEAAHADPAGGGDDDGAGSQREVVQSAAAGLLQGGGDLADDGADLVGGDRACPGELGEGAALDLLGDDDAEVAVLGDLEDAGQPRLGDQGGAPGGIQSGAGAGAGDQVDPDRAVQDGVGGGPRFGAGQVGDQRAGEPVAAADRGTGGSASGTGRGRAGALVCHAGPPHGAGLGSWLRAMLVSRDRCGGSARR
ncbi:hypothetical protein [Cellulomonas denverensis]|uniref:hypothetical protein n=1 Tax=Cellulomonas denverensis TaxID=264297 RepID=UPI0035E850CD